MVPSLAAQVKHLLGIRNNFCVAYDVLFGCPGWIEGVIQANAFISAGIAKRCLSLEQKRFPVLWIFMTETA
jgi:3-oxoacyl-[acyl-carrier-protein] synthase-3